MQNLLSLAYARSTFKISRPPKDNLLVAVQTLPARESSLARPASLLATKEKKKRLGGQSVPARPSERAKKVSFADDLILFNKAQSPSRRRRWAVSEKSGIDFSEGPSSEVDTLSVSIINSASSQTCFVSYLNPVIWKATVLFSHPFIRRPSVRRRRSPSLMFIFKDRGSPCGAGNCLLNFVR